MHDKVLTNNKRADPSMKKIKLSSILIFSASLSFLSPQSVKAFELLEGCANYPYVPMQSKFVPKGNGLFSLQMTQAASVRSDSQSQKNKALKIALLRGEGAISKFIEQEIEGKDSFSTESVENAVENADGVDWEIDEAQSFMETVSASSKNLIRGILPIGGCYEAGKYVRVTVGIKPETIAAAGNASATSNKPFSGYRTKTNSSSPSNSSSEDGTSSPVRSMQPFNTAPSFSGYDADF